MLQTCQKCGNESPTGDNFCRQCGALFMVESASSGAATRNYIKQETPPSVANAGSGYFPPSVADAIVGDTERYYQPPNLPLPPAQFNPQVRPKYWRWRWSLWILALLLSAVIGSVMTMSIFRHSVRIPTPPGLSREVAEAQRNEQNRKRDIMNRIRDSKRRADDAMQHSRQAVDRLREASEQAREAWTELRPTNEKLLDLSKYMYPNVTSGSSSRIPGYESLTMRTTDNFETVKQFYEKMLGQPVVFINEPYEKWAIFQSDKDPLSSVYVESEFEGQVRIVGLRYPIRILPFEDALIKK